MSHSVHYVHNGRHLRELVRHMNSDEKWLFVCMEKQRDSQLFTGLGPLSKDNVWEISSQLVDLLLSDVEHRIDLLSILWDRLLALAHHILRLLVHLLWHLLHVVTWLHLTAGSLHAICLLLLELLLLIVHHHWLLLAGLLVLHLRSRLSFVPVVWLHI